MLGLRRGDLIGQRILEGTRDRHLNIFTDVQFLSLQRSHRHHSCGRSPESGRFFAIQLEQILGDR